MINPQVSAFPQQITKIEADSGKLAVSFRVDASLTLKRLQYFFNAFLRPLPKKREYGVHFGIGPYVNSKGPVAISKEVVCKWRAIWKSIILDRAARNLDASTLSGIERGAGAEDDHQHG